MEAFSGVWRSDGALYLMGELDLASEADAVAALAERPKGLDELVIDLSGLSFMDSTGIRVLEGVVGGPDAVRVVLRAARPPVLRVLELVGVPGWPNVSLRAAGAERAPREDLLIF